MNLNLVNDTMANNETINNIENNTVAPDVQTSGKRPSEEEFKGPPTKKTKSDVRSISIAEKNPISVLNELRCGLKYDFVEQTGPPHSPTFKAKVEVDGQTYYGTGKSKKAAKCQAAHEALKSFIQFPSNGAIISANHDNILVKQMDFTSDQIVNKGKETDEKNKCVKGPLMLLNELYPNAVFTYECNESDSFARFKYTINIQNHFFIGSGSNKRKAKNAAALAALSKLINYSTDPASNLMYPEMTYTSEDQERADIIGRLVNEKFFSLMAHDIVHIKRKVLAGIVMTRNSSIKDAEVICVTTGTKCIAGDYISIKGASLNDMHAEILARRCLINYFYEQLELLLHPETASESIFEKEANRIFKLKDGIDFHLYINTAPCGDARIFSPHEENSSIDTHPNRISRGLLRSKIESGEGTIPVKSAQIVQTWDGIIQGERLLTMSCSDKICKWNVLGLQGALLTHFIEPIYLKTIVLGSLMKESHLKRAICGRIENTLQGLPPPYLLNRPAMLRLTSVETRQPQKAPSFAVVWSVNIQTPEIISTNEGKPENGISFISKQNFATRFIKLYNEFYDVMEFKSRPDTYMSAKEQVELYNVAKARLYEAFKKAQLGVWVSKPIEQDMFELS